MQRFIQINEDHINMDAVQTYRFTKEGHLHIDFKNEEITGFDVSKKDAYSLHNEISGARHAVQVIPCNIPLWAVWVMDDGSHYAERVYYLGLCADGNMRALTIIDGCFEVEDCSNLNGLYFEKDLSRFKNLERADGCQSPQQ